MSGREAAGPQRPRDVTPPPASSRARKPRRNSVSAGVCTSTASACSGVAGLAPGACASRPRRSSAPSPAPPRGAAVGRRARRPRSRRSPGNRPPARAWRTARDRARASRSSPARTAAPPGAPAPPSIRPRSAPRDAAPPAARSPRPPAAAPPDRRRRRGCELGVRCRAGWLAAVLRGASTFGGSSPRKYARVIASRSSSSPHPPRELEKRPRVRRADEAFRDPPIVARRRDVAVEHLRPTSAPGRDRPAPRCTPCSSRSTVRESRATDRGDRDRATRARSRRRPTTSASRAISRNSSHSSNDRRLERTLDRLGLLARLAQLLGEHVHVQHQHQPMDREREEILRQLAQPLHENLLAGFEHHAQPQREALGPKRLVAAGSRRLATDRRRRCARAAPCSRARPARPRLRARSDR